ncbi:flagellar biosynthesis protein FlhB [Natronobacillus azotifigens]
MLILLYTLIYIVSIQVLGGENFYLDGVWFIPIAIRAFNGLSFNPLNFVNFFYRNFSMNNLLELLAASLSILYFYIFKGYINSFPELITYPILTFFFYSTCFIDIEEVLVKKHVNIKNSFKKE